MQPECTGCTPPQVAYLAIERRQSDPHQGSGSESNFSHFQRGLALLAAEPGVLVAQEEMDFPQAFSYTRVPELTLWRVQSTLP
jgi:hypothetical protein